MDDKITITFLKNVRIHRTLVLKLNRGRLNIFVAPPARSANFSELVCRAVILFPKRGAAPAKAVANGTRSFKVCFLTPTRSINRPARGRPLRNYYIVTV